MGSEVEGATDSGESAHRQTTAGWFSAQHPSVVARVLRRPFRPVLLRLARVERGLAAALAQQSDAMAQLERQTRLEVGNQSGRFLGELSDLRLALHQLAVRQPPEQGDDADPEVEPVGEGLGAAVPAPVPCPVGTGVNLIADLTATTGLAQAGRRLAVGLHRRGVALATTPVRSGAPQMDSLCPADLRDLPGGTPYPVDLVTLNINEVPAVAVDRLGRAHTGRPAAATWYWEFESLSPEMVEQLGRVDEIWAPTTFVQAALGAYTTTPIHIVPTIVPCFEVGEPRDDVRRHWGVTPDDVVFLFTFDFNSSVIRKNPLGVVEAYRRAFGSDRTGTRLVIKAMNLANSPRFEADLRAAVEAVEGVVIDEHLTDGELADVFHAADVYVSLHRSEGFGLGMAEAMALGKAVMGTAYSGNVDFMVGGNSALIGYRLRPIVPNDHRYNQAESVVYRIGYPCAEPDLDQAARWMRALAADSALRDRLGAAAATTMATRFSEAAVVDLALARLDDLWGSN